MEELSQQDFAALLEFRSRLRRFLVWSERQAKEAGLTSRQHQLLLAVKGHTDERGPTVGELADYLQLRHHSTVELIDRAVEAGLVARCRDEDDARVIRVRMRAGGDRTLLALTRQHLIELRELAPALDHLAAALEHLGELGTPVLAR
ncbi:MAG TPA: helix-turn-helix domain-containing protein [Actinoallomurus sp.]|nr:helix-turn-helix domain-containing protein [Actinoallomurus sp.]